MQSVLLKIKESDVTVNEMKLGNKQPLPEDREECMRNTLSEALLFELSLKDEKRAMGRPGVRLFQKVGPKVGMNLAF